MANSFREFKQKNLGTANFCAVSVVPTYDAVATGVNNAAGFAKAEFEDGVVVISISSASSGGDNKSQVVVLKNFPYKFEIIDVTTQNRKVRGTKLPALRFNKNTATLASTIVNYASIGAVNVVKRATTIDPSYVTIDKTDKIVVRVTSGSTSVGYSFRAYLRVIPART